MIFVTHYIFICKTESSYRPLYSRRSLEMSIADVLSRYIFIYVCVYFLPLNSQGQSNHVKFHTLLFNQFKPSVDHCAKILQKNICILKLSLNLESRTGD